MDEPEPIDPSKITSGPIRNESLSPEVIEQMEAVYELIGPYLGQTLEQSEVALVRDSCPEDEAVIWVKPSFANNS